MQAVPFAPSPCPALPPSPAHQRLPQRGALRKAPEDEVISIGHEHGNVVISGRPHDLTAETLEQTQICFIPRDGFLRFLHRNGDVSLRLAQRLSNELYDAYRQVRGAVLKQAAERLTELLLVLCETQGQRTRDGFSITSNLSQQELAEMIGVSRRSLTRTLARLKRLRIIECRRRHILVRDLAALRDWFSAEQASACPRLVTA